MLEVVVLVNGPMPMLIQVYWFGLLRVISRIFGVLLVVVLFYGFILVLLVLPNPMLFFPYGPVLFEGDDPLVVGWLLLPSRVDSRHFEVIAALLRSKLGG